MMDADTYQELAARTIDPELTVPQQEAHALHGMVAEIGEVHGIYQKFFQGHEPDEEHMRKEIGDLMWFVAEYCTSVGWTLSDVMETDIEKLKRRYPNGFETERSLHREKGDI